MASETKVTTIRMDSHTRAIVDAHGGPTEAIPALICRYDDLLSGALPRNLSEDECLAICGALKGYPLWLQAGSRLGDPGQCLALEVADYHRLDPSESGQIPVDWEALAGKCAGYGLLEVMALGHAVEAVFCDRSDDLAAFVQRHFRLP